MPRTELHDGAVIIRGDAVLAAAALLPLTEMQLSERFGTRHRAALGITEDTDAVAVVVSEESGQMSVVERARIVRVPSEAQLERALLAPPRGPERAGRHRPWRLHGASAGPAASGSPAAAGARRHGRGPPAARPSPRPSRRGPPRRGHPADAPCRRTGGPTRRTAPRLPSPTRERRSRRPAPHPDRSSTTGRSSWPRSSSRPCCTRASSHRRTARRTRVPITVTPVDQPADTVIVNQLRDVEQIRYIAPADLGRLRAEDFLATVDLSDVEPDGQPVNVRVDDDDGGPAGDHPRVPAALDPGGPRPAGAEDGPGHRGRVRHRPTASSWAR